MSRHPAEVSTHSRRLVAGPSVLRWILLCAGAEAVGMTAAAGAARGWQLARWLPALDTRRYLLATVVVAGLGWAAASAPATLSGDGGAGNAPSLPVVLLGATGLGLVMGTLLGAAQATALRGAVSHPWRWVSANAVAWPLAMALIFLGATTPGADWPVGRVLLLGALTGALAGAALGAVTGWFLPSLTGTSPHNRVVLALLESRWHGSLDGSLVGLEVHGRRTGRCYRLPVQYALDPRGLVVVPGHAERKSWWTNLRRPGTTVEVLWRGGWHPGLAEVLPPAHPDHAEALSTYHSRFPRVVLPADQVLVRIRDAARSGNP